MAAKAPPIELPPLYYLTYFGYLTDFVREKYAHILRVSETDFLDKFSKLNLEAQCLFVRLITRRGIYFPVNRLQYDEVPDLPSTITELKREGFLHSLCQDDSIHSEELVNKLTKDEILALLRWLGDLTSRKSWAKERLSNLLLEHGFEEICEGLEELSPIVRCGKCDEVEFIFFLFFGNLDNNLSDFVIRDVGYVRLEEIKAEHLTPQFATRLEAEEKLFLCQAYATFRHLREGLPPDELYEWYMEVVDLSRKWTPPARPVLDRLTVRLGHVLERLKEWDLAKRVYSHTTAPPARERLVRIYRMEGDTEAATALARAMVCEPRNAEEYYFARDYLETGSTRSRIKRSMTTLLKQSEEIFIQESHRGYVEGGALAYFTNQGYRGFHCENYLWRSLFGLVFWEELFDGETHAFHHPLQRTPSDLYHGGFYEGRQERLMKCTTILDDHQGFTNYAVSFFRDKQGINNPFIGWNEDTLPSLMACVSLVGSEPLKKVLIEMCRNVKENGRGFPDLFIFKDNSYEFIEVKSPNDQLSAQQLYWLEFLSDTGINARVLRVGFT